MEPLSSTVVETPHRRRALLALPALVVAFVLVVGITASWASTRDPNSIRRLEAAAPGGLVDGLPNGNLNDCPAKVLVSYDMSGSIESAGPAAVQAVKDSVKGFVRAFQGLPVQVRVMGWATNAPAYMPALGPMGGYSLVDAGTLPAFESIVDNSNFSLPSSQQWTNHDAALRAAWADGAPDVMVLVTDGVPTKAGGNTIGPFGAGGPLVGTDPDPAFGSAAFQLAGNAAINSANGLKFFAGTHIIPVAVSVPNFWANFWYFEQLGPGDVQAAANWGLLSLALNNIAARFCTGGSVITENPSIEIRPPAPTPTLPEGTSTSVTFQVCNTGDVVLNDVSFTAAGEAPRPMGSLGVGECRDQVVGVFAPVPSAPPPGFRDEPGAVYPDPVQVQVSTAGTSPAGQLRTDSATVGFPVSSRGPRPT